MSFFKKNDAQKTFDPIMDGADEEMLIALNDLATTKSCSKELQDIWKFVLNRYCKLPIGEKIIFNEQLASICTSVIDMDAYMKNNLVEYSTSHPEDIVGAMNFLMTQEGNSIKIMKNGVPVMAPKQAATNKPASKILQSMMTEYPVSLIGVDCSTHQYELIANQNMVMSISDNNILFSPAFIQHMMNVLGHTDESVNMRYTADMQKMYPPYNSDERTELGDEYPLHAIPEELSVYFGVCDRAHLTVSVVINQIGTAEPFRLRRDDKTSTWYLNKTDTNIIKTSINNPIMTNGNYIFQFMEGTNTYIGDQIKDPQNQGFNYKMVW